MPASVEAFAQSYMQEDTFIWQPVIDGRTYDVPVPVLRHPDALVEGVPQVHFYAGLGGEHRSTSIGIHTLGEKGLAAVGVILPFHYLPPEERYIERTVIEVPHAVAEAYNDMAGNPFDAPVDIIGHSQGGGAAIITASEAPEKFGAIDVWAPAGLTPDVFGTSELGKRLRFIWRLGIVDALARDQSWFRDTENIGSAREVMHRVIDDVRGRRLTAKLNYALALDLAGAVEELSRDHDVVIFAGATDPLYRVSEYGDVLREVGAEGLLSVIPGSHTATGNRAWRQQLGIVADWMIDTRDKRQRQAARDASSPQ